MWIGWQWPLLRASQFLELSAGAWIPNVGVQSLQIREDCTEQDVWFGELGYAREARASYDEFLDARNNGLLAPGTRLQVCLPTPIAVIGGFVIPRDIPRVLPAYERAMLHEIEKISASIPHADLAFQWDTCIEMIQWDGRFPAIPPVPHMEEQFRATFGRLCASAPKSVELGIHLCYGDHDNKHMIEPADLGKAVELANLIQASAGRTLNWIHMPVPISRDDVAYFAPLKHLQRGSQTELYLGLVHWQDGVEGSMRRAAAARQIVSDFGIGTECGLGRARSRDKAREIMRVQAAIAALDPGSAALGGGRA
jgi:methionine synthase II (cobalamin-independent)